MKTAELTKVDRRAIARAANMLDETAQIIFDSSTSGGKWQKSDPLTQPAKRAHDDHRYVAEQLRQVLSKALKAKKGVA